MIKKSVSALWSDIVDEIAQAITEFSLSGNQQVRFISILELTGAPFSSEKEILFSADNRSLARNHKRFVDGSLQNKFTLLPLQDCK